jgi:hypothetical protein
MTQDGQYEATFLHEESNAIFYLEVTRIPDLSDLAGFSQYLIERTEETFPDTKLQEQSGGSLGQRKGQRLTFHTGTTHLGAAYRSFIWVRNDSYAVLAQELCNWSEREKAAPHFAALEQNFVFANGPEPTLTPIMPSLEEKLKIGPLNSFPPYGPAPYGPEYQKR